jgi:hypothetical protein
MVKVNGRGRTQKFSEMNKAKKNLMTKNSKSGTTIHKSKASTNPHRPDPSGGKKGS